MIKDMGIAQAARGYYPTTLTHYKADWIEGADEYSLPVWPTLMIPKYLYAIGKRDVQRSIYRIQYNFTRNYVLDVNVASVSVQARLVAKADGTIIFYRQFDSRPGRGEWTTVVFRDDLKVYQNIYNRDYRIDIPAGTKLVTLEVTDGDWLSVNDLKFSPSYGTGTVFNITPNNFDYGAVIPPLNLNASGKVILDNSIVGRPWLWESYFKPWEELMESGCGVMIGEWGSHNKTPHDVVLRWMEDNLQNFKAGNMGWALKNLHGSFGVLNSGRTDVKYENFSRQKLDRKMLDLLLKYLE